MGDANKLEHNLKRAEPNQQISMYFRSVSCATFSHQQHGVKLYRVRVKPHRSRRSFRGSEMLGEEKETEGSPCGNWR